MAIIKQVSLLLILPLLLISSLLDGSFGAGIATYWGQHGEEGSLVDACNSGNYQFINIAFLTLSTSNGQTTPKLNLGNHCNPDDNTCTHFGDEIKTCQAQKIKILLSIGGAPSANSEGYSLGSTNDANDLARYIWENFLQGNSASRPFGDAQLDGIDFDIESGDGQHWDELARVLKGLNNQQLILSAAPQCPFPDKHLSNAINTGVFDYVWVQFYNNQQCHYSGDIGNVLAAWNEWTSSPVGYVLLMGVPASEKAAKGGFIPPEVMTSKILPMIKGSPKYGGVMIWDRSFDLNPGYSSTIKAIINN